MCLGRKHVFAFHIVPRNFILLNQLHKSMINLGSSVNDDIITWKTYHITDCLWGQSTKHWWIPLPKGPVMQSFDVFFVIKLPNKQSSCQCFADIMRFMWCQYQKTYRQVFNIRRTKSKHLKDSHTVLWWSLRNPLKPDVKSRMKM